MLLGGMGLAWLSLAAHASPSLAVKGRCPALPCPALPHLLLVLMAPLALRTYPIGVCNCNCNLRHADRQCDNQGAPWAAPRMHTVCTDSPGWHVTHRPLRSAPQFSISMYVCVLGPHALQYLHAICPPPCPAPAPPANPRRWCLATTAPPATCGPTRRSYRMYGRPSDLMARVTPAFRVTRVNMDTRTAAMSALAFLERYSPVNLHS